MAGTAAQIDLFGTAYLVGPKVAGRKYATMQEMHGTRAGSMCRECANLVKVNHGRTVYKCARWKFTGSVATDVDAAQDACGKFVPY